METESSNTASSKILESFSCKIIPNSDSLPGSNKDWTRAARCTLNFTENGLEYLDYITPYAEITQATIHIYQSAFFFEYGIFSLSTAEYTHHFGIKYSEYWKGELPFPVERIENETPYILFRKSLIILILIYIFWEVVKK